MTKEINYGFLYVSFINNFQSICYINDSMKKLPTYLISLHSENKNYRNFVKTRLLIKLGKDKPTVFRLQKNKICKEILSK